MLAPKKVMVERQEGKMDHLLEEKKEVMNKYFFSEDRSIEERNEAIRAFNKKWLAAGGLPATCIALV